MDLMLVERLGDRAVREDGTVVAGAFSSPHFGNEMKGGAHKIGEVANPDEVKQPTFHLRSVDAASIKKGSALKIDLPEHLGGGTYVVVKHDPDGFGFVDLVLRLDRERTASVT